VGLRHTRELPVSAFDKHDKQGAQIPVGVHTTIKENFFIPEEFDDVVRSFAKANASVADLLKELQEPFSGGKHSIPWLGEADIKDNLEHLVARGVIALNLRGSIWIQALAGESETDALNRVRGKLSNVTGTHLAQTTLHEPSSTPSAGGVTPAVAEPGATPAGGGAGGPPIPGGFPPPGGLFGGSAPLPPQSGIWRVGHRRRPVAALGLPRWCLLPRPPGAYLERQLSAQPARHHRGLGHRWANQGARAANFH
jgi:hypothetical protein